MARLVIEGDVARDLREQARAAWQEQIEGDPPQGWSVCPLNLSKIVEVFAPLRLKPGFVLRAYQNFSSHGAHTVAYALPADAPFPEPDDPDAQPPPPAAALPDIMDAIEGEGSPRSYFHASLLARELAEAGAYWHGIRWGAAHILDGFPWQETNDDPVTPEQERPTNAPADWTWEEAMPSEWRPVVETGDRGATVTITIYMGLGVQVLQLLRDTYAAAGYTPARETHTLARDGFGYVW